MTATGRARRLVAGVGLLFVMSCGSTAAIAPTVIAPITDWKPLPPLPGARSGPDGPPPHATPTPQPTKAPRPSVKPVVQVRPIFGHRASGRASWFCRAGVSICHHSYPPGSMVAAACGKLRAAIGPGWRGRIVTVTDRGDGDTVTIRLVDWCGSRDKLIDLYWEPMRRLGGTGVLSVTVSWK